MDSQERRYAKYLEIARATKAFNEAEIGVLEEVLQDCLVEQSEEGYILLAEQDKGEDVAFLIYGKTPMTEFTYDLYWIVVSPSYQGKGIGRRLVNRMESLILAKRRRQT